MNMISFDKVKRIEVDKLLYFIKELAIYEKKLDSVVATKELLEYWLFEKQVCEAIFLNKDNETIGFALYFYNFSTFLGKPGIYLEDLFIKKEYRNLGYGTQVFKYLVTKAQKEDLGRIEWSCLTWNTPAIKFYEKLGAVAKNEWFVFQLTSKNVSNLLKA